MISQIVIRVCFLFEFFFYFSIVCVRWCPCVLECLCVYIVMPVTDGV